MLIMDSYKNLDDNGLSHEIQNGQSGAFKELYSRYNSLLYIYAYRLLKDEEQAKDIVQEVFVKIWNNRGNGTHMSSLAGYMYQSVRNLCLNIFARKKVQQSYLNSLGNLLEAHTSGTDYRIREKEIASLITEEINRLPSKMRQIFLMSRLEEKSYKQIAASLDVSEETVRTQIKRALKQLKSRLHNFPLITF